MHRRGLMPGSSVAAVVVTFHPDAGVVENLAILRPNVEHVVVVDNGSDRAELQLIREASLRIGFQLIENGENLGIATALNLGIRCALGLQVGWISLFDQDSRLTPGYIETMLRGFRQREAVGPVGLLVPVYNDLRTGFAIPADWLPDGSLEVTVTSGSLLRAETFMRCGLFVDELFIDGVDHEYSLRLRKAGFPLYECAEATLLHSPGTPAQHQLPAGKKFQTANYSPIRRYYQERNKIWLAKHYAFRFPRFCLRMFVVSLKDFTKICFVEPDDRLRKVKFFLRGTWDGIRGRYGKL